MKRFLIFLILFSFRLHATEEKTIHVEEKYSKGSWTEYTSSDELNLKRLIELLSKSKTGDRILKEARFKAASTGHTLIDVIKIGEGSLTDTTLVRKFSPASPDNVIYESRSVVYLNRHLTWDDALLDLAHELTHFVYREAFNPYAESFNAKDFIKGTIEGSGGEVQAFLTECKVLKELFSSKVQGRSHCQKIEDSEGQLSFSKAVELFYHVGNYYDSMDKKLSEKNLQSADFNLKADKINFISSAYGVPYPVAALMEYELVLSKVCENDKKRIAYVQQGQKRGPASVGSDKLLQSYKTRCSIK
ncbi:MAG: hypothetical protein AB7I27_16250 [Bacteriovoracaceae bacterium]